MSDPLIESAKEIEALRSRAAGDASELEHLRGSIEALREQVAALTEDRKEGLAAMNSWVQRAGELEQQLAAPPPERNAYRSVAEGEPLDAYQAVCDQLAIAQARIKELREALEKRMASENRWSDYIIEALATPDDSSALDAALKADANKWADMAMAHGCTYMVTQIRSMK